MFLRAVSSTPPRLYRGKVLSSKGYKNKFRVKLLTAAPPTHTAPSEERLHQLGVGHHVRHLSLGSRRRYFTENARHLVVCLPIALKVDLIRQTKHDSKNVFDA